MTIEWKTVSEQAGVKTQQRRTLSQSHRITDEIVRSEWRLVLPNGQVRPVHDEAAAIAEFSHEVRRAVMAKGNNTPQVAG